MVEIYTKAGWIIHLIFQIEKPRQRSRNQTTSCWGEHPFNGSACIGLRLVRRESGLPKPLAGETSGIPNWTIKPDTTCAADPSRQLSTPLPADYLALTPIPGKPFSLGTYEVTFAKWRPVLDWAVANGYSFDSDGEMGSMSYWGFGDDWQVGSHSAQEPVTGMTHYDAMVWLNALSEMSGRTPAYEDGKKGGAAIKSPYVFRPPQLMLGETRDVVAGWGRAFTFIRANPKANGYRLPEDKEFYEIAGKKFGKDCLPANVLEHAWLADNSGLRSHEVGKTNAGPHGLFDLYGNVSELGSLTDKGSHGTQLLLGYASRNGGGFFDTVEGFGRREFMQSRGLGYPDVGLRVLCPSK